MPKPAVRLPARAAARWQPWETAKPEERATLLTITNTIGEEWADDEPVVFLGALEQVNLAALWAIRLELATWGFNELN